MTVNESNFILHIRYGDIFSIDAGVFRQIMVRDLDLLRDMMARDAFSGRGKIRVMGLDIFSILRGGHGGHGLVHSEGNKSMSANSAMQQHVENAPLLR